MKVRVQKVKGGRAATAAFTLVEAIVSVLLLAIASVSLFAGFSSGFWISLNNREELRATQILLQKLEGVRLCTWSSLRSFQFKETYDPVGASTNSGGVIYVGTVTTNAAPGIAGSMTYGNNVVLVTASVTWTNYSGSKPVAHTRQMQTLVAKYGLQNYIWGLE